MSNVSKFNTDFESIVDDVDEIDKKRRKIERNLFNVVLVLVVMGFVTAGFNSTAIQSVVSWFSPVSEHNVTITFHSAVSGNNLTVNSTQEFPTFNNTFVRFNVSFSDVDLDDWHTMFMCNGTSNNYTLSTDGMTFRFNCNGMQLCNYSNKIMTTDNPMACDFRPLGFANQTQNFTAFVVDSGKKVGYASGTFAIDRPPYIINIKITRL